VQELSIKVNIADRQYPLKIQAGDEENVRRAARRVNERLKEYVENYAVADRQDALAMIALEFATEFFTDPEKGAGLDSDTQGLIRDIESKLDQALRPSLG
jgi:cell division protein ZapA